MKWLESITGLMDTSLRNSRIPPQLQKRHVAPPSSQDEALAPYSSLWASLVAQRVKRLPAMQETWVQSLGWEDPLEKGKAPHSSTLSWKIPWLEEPGGLQYMGWLSCSGLVEPRPVLPIF